MCISLPNLATLSKHNHKIYPHNHKRFYMDDNIEFVYKCDKNHRCYFASFLLGKENNQMLKISDFLTVNKKGIQRIDNIKKYFKKASTACLNGKKTNHSARKTKITALARNNVLT